MFKKVMQRDGVQYNGTQYNLSEPVKLAKLNLNPLAVSAYLNSNRNILKLSEIYDGNTLKLVNDVKTINSGYYSKETYNFHRFLNI